MINSFKIPGFKDRLLSGAALRLALFILLPIFSIFLSGLVITLVAVLAGRFSTFWFESVVAAEIVVGIELLFSSVVIGYAKIRFEEYVAYSVLVAIMVRIVATVAGLVFTAFFLEIRAIEFFIYVMLFYFIGLIVEGVLTVRLLSLELGLRS